MACQLSGLRMCAAIFVLLAVLQPSAVRGTVTDLPGIQMMNVSCPEYLPTFLAMCNCTTNVGRTLDLADPSKACALVRKMDEACWPDLRSVKVTPRCEPIASEIKSWLDLVVNECKTVEKDDGVYKEAWDCYQKHHRRIFKDCVQAYSPNITIYNLDAILEANPEANPKAFIEANPEAICTGFAGLEHCIVMGVRTCTCGVKLKVRALLPFVNRFLQTFGFISPSCDELQIATKGRAMETTNNIPFTVGADGITCTLASVGAEGTTNGALSSVDAEGTTNGAIFTLGAEETTNGAIFTLGAEETTNGALSTVGVGETSIGTLSSFGASSPFIVSVIVLLMQF